MGCHLRNVNEEECRGNTIYVGDRLSPGQSVILTITVKLPEDLLGYQKITLKFRFEDTQTSLKDKNGLPIRSYFGDTLVGFITLIGSNPLSPMVYAPSSSLMQPSLPEPVASSAKMPARGNKEDLKVLEDLMQ